MALKTKLVMVTVRSRNQALTEFVNGTIDEQGRASVPTYIVEGMLKKLGVQDGCTYSIG
jgi:hypothetical protein